MKKFLFIIIVLIVVIFAFISIQKLSPTKIKTEKNTNDLSLKEKEDIRKFWLLYRRANENRIAGRLNEAAEQYIAALVFNVQHEDALYYLGNVYADLEKYEAAEKCWQKLIYINPNSVRAYFQLGNLYLNFPGFDFFDIDKAESNFHSALELNKEESGCLFRLGQIELIRGNYSGARSYFKILTGSNYKNLDVYFLNSYIDWIHGKQDTAISEVISACQLIRKSKPLPNASHEGDTKSGQPIYVSNQAGRNSLFYNYTYDLANLDERSLLIDLPDRYKKLEKFIDLIKKR